MDLTTALQSDIISILQAVAVEGRQVQLFLRSEIYTADRICYTHKSLSVIYSQAKKAARAIAEHELNSGDPTTWTDYLTLNLVVHPAVIVCYLAFDSVYEAINPDNKLTLHQFATKTRASTATSTSPDSRTVSSYKAN